MAGDVAESAGETAGDVVEAAVTNAVAQVEGAVEAAEARAEAAEEALEAITDSARRDVLHELITDLEGELEECRALLEQRTSEQATELAALRSEMTSLREQLTELATRSTATTVSIRPASPGTPALEEPAVTITTVNPADASPAPMPESPAAPANQRRWI